MVTCTGSQSGSLSIDSPGSGKTTIHVTEPQSSPVEPSIIPFGISANARIGGDAHLGSATDDTIVQQGLCLILTLEPKPR
jgi:hypothetical protein